MGVTFFSLLDSELKVYNNKWIIVIFTHCHRRIKMSAKTYIEPQTTIPVYDECDVLVVRPEAIEDIPYDEYAALDLIDITSEE